MSFLADVLAHTAFFMAFLPAFFFGYVSPVQLQSLIKDAFNILKPELSNVALSTNPNLAYKVTGTIDTLSQEMQTNPDITSYASGVEDKNKKVITYLAIAVGIGAPILLVSAFLIEYYTGGDVIKLLVSNLIVITFIAISEFAIVGLFLKNFVEIDGDFVKATAVNSAENPWGVEWSHCYYVSQFAQQRLPTPIYNMFFS